MFSAKAQYRIEVLDSNTFQLGEGVILSKTSFRGLSVVDDQTIWVSGSRGTMARSVDGGKTFIYTQLKGYEKSDFRDVEAFDAKRAIIMSSGTPAYILKTTDGGQTWKEVYKNTDTAYFLDGMDFWDDKRGMLVGDPVNGHFLLMQTKDGGKTWKELDSTQTPEAMEGEAVFAASGTSIRCWGKNDVGIVSGGMLSRLFVKNMKSKGWLSQFNVLPSEKQSSGCFSIVYHYGHIVGIGGDYLKEKNTSANYFILNLKDPKILTRTTEFYFSCIESLDVDKFIFCGTSACTIDDIGLKETIHISLEPFHVVRKAKNGKAVFLAGPKGKIGKLVW